ncbi:MULTISPECIES: sulfatase [unclassified Lentimonas]|uniref:sulfatase n=1 Tax=unclassified Lentimonas TaxID=2630993 RepID=UPI001329D6A6|nr:MULTISPECIES: sulfatase [unclassified Lentimonas]CAA6689439.1 Choline-sulfatase (EC [Lentimonas sp. CC10]CAA6696412.1 Choline-sulfatase (EC [Lentimonas sp. CC19]CAA7070504.1 Choline-sulfatase (EC [Lentimonas sp. CC11]
MNTLRLAATLLLSLSTLLPAGATIAQKNILFIIIDDLNMDVGVYGNAEVSTPNIDQLAAKGLTFDRAYTNGTICSASRNSFLAGIRTKSGSPTDYVFNQPINPNNGNPNSSYVPNFKSLPRHFKDNGFHTAGIGKVFHDISHTTPGDFDVTVSEEDDGDIKIRDEDGKLISNFYRVESIERKFDSATDAATGAGTNMGRDDADEEYMDGANFLELEKFVETTWDREKPFFISYGIHKPHTSLTCPKRFWDLYDRASLTLPEVPDGWEPPNAWTLGGHDGVTFTGADWRLVIHAYYACISWADYLVGSAIQLLEDEGVLDNTLIVLTTDHGWHNGRNKRLQKHILLSGTTQVPLIVWDPGTVPAGTRTDTIAELVDIYPTLVDWADLPLPAHVAEMDGKSLVPVLKDPSINLPSKAFIFRSTKHLATQVSANGERVQTARYAFVRWNVSNDTNHIYPEEIYYELYDSLADPEEYVNLAYDSNYLAIRDYLEHVVDNRTTTPSTYAQWELLNIPPDMARGQDGDADGDNITNYMEWATGSDPLNGASRKVIDLTTRTNGQHEVEFRISNSQNGIVEIMADDDLNGLAATTPVWSSTDTDAFNTAHPAVNSVTDTPTFKRIELDASPTENSNRRFFMLRATDAP